MDLHDTTEIFLWDKVVIPRGIFMGNITGVILYGVIIMNIIYIMKKYGIVLMIPSSYSTTGVMVILMGSYYIPLHKCFILEVPHPRPWRSNP